MASSSKALGELLGSPKRLRPISLSPESMTLKSPLSTLHAPPLAAGEHPSALTSEQAKRVDAGGSLSRWKRNLSICSKRIATRKGTRSDPYVKLGELLVEETWLEALSGELQKPYAQNLCRFVEMEMRSSVPIYPPPHLIFNALHLTSFDEVKAGRLLDLNHFVMPHCMSCSLSFLFLTHATTLTFCAS
ncbi:uracil-DNA glycosylase, mitochondrial-like [Zingiber officinale]|uniref:uracil-DNA glycosylase, mitochondrial-like n=1 Tax=Zingiber officinale TaxID=94328 RepID=UPI001C4CC5BB|nr:uracil-DNA glycosylase, mitochondrial-like [Zingiber officinale]